MSDGDLEAVLHEMEFSPKERIAVGSGVGNADAASLRFLRFLESAGQTTDGRGLPIKLEQVMERQRIRVRLVDIAL